MSSSKRSLAMFTKRSRLLQGGVTLIELIVFLVIISIGVVGILQVMSLTSAASVDPLRRKQALMIAESLMEEVTLARFTLCDADDPDVLTATTTCTIPEAPGRTTGEVRPYNHINDYVTAYGTATSTAFNNISGKLADVSGTAFPEGYTATLKIEEAALNGIGGADGTSLRVTVTVTDTMTTEQITLESFRLRYAPNSPS